MEPYTDPDHAASIRRTFAWRSAVVFVAVGVLTQLLVNSIVAGHFEESLEFHAQFVTRAIVEPLLPPDLSTDPAVADVAEGLDAETELDTQVTALEVVGPDGVVRASSAPERVGEVAMSTPGDGEHLTQVQLQGRSDIARVDVLQDRSATEAAAAQMRGRLAVLLLGGLLLLWLMLLPVANRLGRRLQERTDEVETQRSELARLLDQERETTQRLAEVNELKDSFLTAVSHELRTPLTVVSGMLSTLRRHGNELSAERRQDLLDRADNSAAKLGDLLGGLLTLNGKERPRSQAFETLDLAEAVAEVRSHLPPHDLELALDAPRVTADAFGLERILANLLGNALRHAPDSPVRIESEQVVGGVELRVADRGPGVPDDLKQVVYEPFRQGELRDRHSPGTGIGLALVARFVADHGGCTWVDDRPGGGAVFHVRLPDDPSPHEPVGPQAAVCTHDHGAAPVAVVS